MPPKQKQAKKGPTYKPAVLAKDIVPADVKEPPRDPKPLKIPESFPEPPKNSDPLPPLFEEWPSDQVVKAHDFGLNAEAKFLDPGHEQLVAQLLPEGKGEWRHLAEIEHLDESEAEEEEPEQQELNQSKNEIESFRDISTQKVEEPRDGPPCVIETYLRPETEEQMQARQKQQAQRAEKAAKEKKKAAKKEQPKEEGPLQVSDVRMSDIVTRRYMLESAIWIGSQLQIIKQRTLTDVNNGEPVWRKIYPQDNGVPQLTRSGKYWVKLLHMGRYVKVEVDDRVPVNHNHRELLPTSAKPNEKWTLILAKALLKYLSRVRNDEIVGNGVVAYALTGMVAETVPLGQFSEWSRLEELSSNDHYERKDIVASCFANDPTRSFRRPLRVSEEKMESQQLLGGTEREVDTGILSGYAYCIGDYFDNNEFNMVFSQQKSQKEMLLKHEYNELCKVSISNKSREEKLEYRKKKKELKEKLGIEEKKRLELIGRPPLRYRFLKLLARLRVGCEYGEREILLAKKCVLNRLNQPPNYDIPLEKEDKDTKSIQSLSVSVIKYKEESELFPNLHDFSSIPNVSELLDRKEKGKWINDQDFLDFFAAVQILYNPNAFPHKRIEPLESKRSSNFTYDENKEILVVEKAEQEGKEEGEGRVRLLLGFAYQKSPKDIFSPYSMVQKFDFDSFRATTTVVTLSSDLSARLIHLNNQNSVFKLYTMSRGNVNFWISADSPFKMLSIADYLTEYEGYTKKNLTFEYPPIEAKTYFPVVRLRLRQEEGEGNTVLAKMVSVKEELLGCLNYRLVAVRGECAQTEQQIEGVISRRSEQLLLAYEYTRFTLEAGVEYYLIVEAQSEENIPDGSLELMLLAKEPGLTVEQPEQVEPVKFIEKYLPNKYGLICRERLFTNADTTATITLRLAEFEEVQGGGAGKAAKKGGKEEPATELQEKPFSDERTIIVRVLNGQTVLYEGTGVNEVTIPNFKFFSTKTAAREYYLQAKFDLRIWPEAVAKSEQTERICWVAQVMSLDSISLVRDTRQEDKEKLTRKSWEDGEPGRAERAKKARRKFLIELKKERGEALTEEQEGILNAPRLTRKQMLEEQRRNEENKKGKGGKKDDKKGGKDAKKEEVVEEKPPERPPPKSQHNFMNEIKEFLQILENCVVKYEPLDHGDPRIRSPEELTAIKEGTKLSAEDRVGKLVRNIEKRETVKLREKEKRESISIFLGEARAQFKEKYNSYIEWRAQDSDRDRARQDKERLLIDLINQEKPAISEPDLKKTIAEYREVAGHNPYLADVADMVRKNIRINNLTDKIAGLLVGWEVEELKGIAEQIKNDGVEGIDGEVLRQLKEMLEEAERNPAIVGEKQAQAKKAKKGGKK